MTCFLACQSHDSHVTCDTSSLASTVSRESIHWTSSMSLFCINNQFEIVVQRNIQWLWRRLRLKQRFSLNIFSTNIKNIQVAYLRFEGFALCFYLCSDIEDNLSDYEILYGSLAITLALCFIWKHMWVMDHVVMWWLSAANICHVFCPKYSNQEAISLLWKENTTW